MKAEGWCRSGWSLAAVTGGEVARVEVFVVGGHEALEREGAALGVGEAARQLRRGRLHRGRLQRGRLHRGGFHMGGYIGAVTLQAAMMGIRRTEGQERS